MTIIICFFISAAPVGIANSPWVDVLLRILLISFVGSIALVYWLPLEDALKFDIAIGLLSIFLSTAVFLIHKNTPYSYNGISGDQGFRTSIITKFANLPGYVDFIYKELPSFYPPLYFYILGKIASLWNIEPYQMIKYGLLGVVFLLPFITQKLWELVTSKKNATIISFIILAERAWYSPIEVMSLFMFVPWWLYFIAGVGTSQGMKNRIWRFVIGGILGSIIFQTYYYWFFIGGISLIVELVLKRQLFNNEQYNSLLDKLLMLGSTALFSSMYWGPYLYSMFVTGGWEPLQNRWFSQYMVTLQLPFMELSITGLLFLGGLVYLLVNFQRDRISFHLFSLFIASYAWFALGYVGAVANRPFLAVKANHIVWYVLCIAAAISLMHLRKQKFFVKFHNSRLVFLLVMVSLLTWFSQQTVSSNLYLYWETTLKTEYPDDLLSAFHAMTNGDYKNKVILTNDKRLPIYLPVYKFISWNAHLSHPAGLFHKRIDFLERLSTTTDPEIFATALMNNKYSKIDYIMLLQDGNSWRLNYSDDNFPRGTKGKSILFSNELFQEAFFSSKEQDGRILFIPLYSNNPIDFDRLTVEDLKGFKQRELVIVYSICGHFGEHVKSDNCTALHEESGILLKQINWEDVSTETLPEAYNILIDSDTAFSKQLHSQILTSDLPPKN
ncbi:MAG: arabinofuranosyltransferase [Promethearchaeota archaeon]